MAVSTTRHHLSPHDAMAEALQGAREALERLRATLGSRFLSRAEPSRQPTEPSASGAIHARAHR